MLDKIPKEVLPLLILYLSGGKIRGRTRFQKLVFLVEHEAPELRDYFAGGYSWSPYHYGPFSDELLDDLALLSYWGLIDVLNESEDIDGESSTTIYELTEKGREIVEEKILPQLPNELVEKLRSLVKKYCELRLLDLIKYVYERYPQYTTRSRIREYVLGAQGEQRWLVSDT